MPEPFRPEPVLSADQMKTYAIIRKDGVHYRPATCEEVECPQWMHGWVTRVPRGTDLEKFIDGRTHGWKFSEITMPVTTEREFIFPSGQECFRSSQHRLPVEREPFFVVRDGDWRGNPRGTQPIVRTADDWTDDFANHQQGIADARRQG